jgi:hypothetical protein
MPALKKPVRDALTGHAPGDEGDKHGLGVCAAGALAMRLRSCLNPVTALPHTAGHRNAHGEIVDGTRFPAAPPSA